MDRNSQILVVAVLALAIASCTSEGESQSSNPTLTNTKPNTTKTLTKQQFNNPVVPTKQSLEVAAASSSLIRLTNAKERLNIVSQGRKDPFAEIVGLSASQVPNTNPQIRPIPILPPLPGAITTGTVTVARTSKQRSAVLGEKLKQPKKPANQSPALNPVLPRVLPQVMPNQALNPVMPPPPQPDLAKAVVVSGVVLVGNQPQAIIKVPNESTSRYVQAGQQLANGVLIKRIEMNEGSEPIVILEQYGIEVARMVGDIPTKSPTATETATVNNPVTLAAPSQNSVSVSSS